MEEVEDFEKLEELEGLWEVEDFGVFDVLEELGVLEELEDFEELEELEELGVLDVLEELEDFEGSGVASDFLLVFFFVFKYFTRAPKLAAESALIAVEAMIWFLVSLRPKISTISLFGVFSEILM